MGERGGDRDGDERPGASVLRKVVFAPPHAAHRSLQMLTGVDGGIGAGHVSHVLRAQIVR